MEQKSEEEKNLQDTIKKLPQKYKDLLKNFNIKLTCKNTLNGDKNHIGYINKFDIEVAAPWNYGREFTLLQTNRKVNGKSLPNFTKASQK
jgi:hypothetical protein